MSIYDIVNNISAVTKIYERKIYQPDDIVAVFYIDEKKIFLYYEDYTKETLVRNLLMQNYTKKIVMMDFWDPIYCTSDNISETDMETVSQKLNMSPADDYSGVVVGFILTLISVYRMIYNSYTVRDFQNVIKDINFDKNILTKILCEVDIVIEFNSNLVDLVRSTISEYDMANYLVTPSQKFRLVQRNISTVLEDTKNIHEISTIMYNFVDHKYIIDYYLELISTSNIIYSPKIINSYSTENILLNVMKIDVDLEANERQFLRFLDAYTDKGGNIDIEFNLEFNKCYGNVIPLLDTFKEYHLS